MNPGAPVDKGAFYRRCKVVCRSIDLVATLLLWVYFTIGFVVLFAPFYGVALLLAAERRQAFQRLNHYFYRGFFLLCRLLIPLHQWHIDDRVRRIRASIIVCNHSSYIDPLLLIALFRRHTTIVKSRLFRYPIFGSVLRRSGYLPSSSDGDLTELMIKRMDSLVEDLRQGANLFIFPEGTRSRDGGIGQFNPGAFKIARLCKAPLKVMMIRHTDRLFQPGRFLFNTCRKNTITVELLDERTPAYDAPGFSTAELMKEVRRCMLAHVQQGMGGAIENCRRP